MAQGSNFAQKCNWTNFLLFQFFSLRKKNTKLDAMWKHWTLAVLTMWVTRSICIVLDVVPGQAVQPGIEFP